MITLMRQSRRALQVGLLVVIAAFVLTSVFVFTQSDPGGAGPDAIATVNGESIPADRYQRAYQNYVSMFSQTAQRTLTPEMAEQMGLPGQVVDALVTETLVVQRARAEGLEATDREVNEYVAGIRAFQDGGRFSLARYREVLKRAGLTDVGFERDVRRELTRAKMETAIRSGVAVTDVEVDAAVRARREEVRAQWALVELAPLIAAATASDAELETHLKEHAAAFRQPERRRIQYVALSPRDFTKPVSDAEAERYYREHPAEFEVPPQVRAAHVLVRVPDTGGSEAEDRARARVADVITRARAGEDFAKLAREVSEDQGTAPGGGELGFVKKGEVVPPFEQALFALKAGEVTAEPVRTPFGFHAIKALEVKTGGRRPFQEVAASLRERLAAEAADAAARARASEVKPPLQVAGDFMAEARTLGLTALETRVSRIPRTPGMPADSLEEAAFGLTLGGVSAPVKTPAGYLVVKALETIPAGVPPLAEIKDAVTAAVKRRKAEAAAEEKARQIAGAGADLAAAAKKAGATTGEARFSRARPAERLPGDAMLAALQTPAGKVTDPVKTPTGIYVLKVLERLPLDPAELARERETARGEVLAQKQGQVWESWLASARAGARIELTGRAPVPRATAGG
jgi:peptidyl-prolyl cis-trans isomerase D